MKDNNTNKEKQANKNSNNKRNIAYALLLSLVVLGSLIAFDKWQGGSSKNKSTQETGNEVAIIKNRTSKGQMKLGGPFKLLDFNGKIKTDKDFRGKYMIVYFGYSYCPDICPEGLSNIAKAIEMLPAKKAKRVQPIFISVDPERDNPEHLKNYMSNFGDKFIALTGSAKEIKKVAKSYKAYYAKAKPDGTSSEYLIDHSSIVYLMDPQGRFVAHFNHSTSPEILHSFLLKVL